MLTLLIALLGFVVIDAIDVLMVGMIVAIVYQSRIRRRSPLASGIAYLGGVVLITSAFGIATVAGLDAMATRWNLHLSPTLEALGALLIGAILLALASWRQRPGGAARPAPKALSNPWLWGIGGLTIGLLQAPTAIPYLAGLALIASRDPLPTAWPVIIVVYCILAVAPAIAVLALALMNTRRSRKAVRWVIRVITRFGPPTVRVIFAVLGTGLLAWGLWMLVRAW